MTKNAKTTAQKKERYGISRYFLLLMALSFLGWVFETTLVLFQTGKFHNQGFMTLPFLPIYGGSLMVTFFLLGTPDEPRVLLKNVEGRAWRYAFYFAFAFIIPTLAELIVGAVLDKAFDMRLWSYTGVPLNFKGYISLLVSLGWAALIFLFMKYFFTPIKDGIGKTPLLLSRILAGVLFSVFVLDVTLSFMEVLPR